jgi:hypothetical protein
VRPSIRPSDYFHLTKVSVETQGPLHPAEIKLVFPTKSLQLIVKYYIFICFFTVNRKAQYDKPDDQR